MENINIKILSKEYQIACPEDLKKDLQAAVTCLDEKMIEIRNNGKTTNFEGILVTAAINLAYEFLKKDIEYSSENQNLAANLTLLTNKLNAALYKAKI